MYKDIDKFYEWIKSSKTIVIAGHINPDGDAIGSSFALARAIFNKFNKRPIILLEDYAEKYNYLKRSEFLYDKDDYDNLEPELFISLDCGSIDRLGKFKPLFEKTPKTVNIDHHISNDSFGKLNFVGPKSSSTSEIVFELIKDLDILDKEIATILYSGIVFDTSGFKHNTTTARTHQIAGLLLDKGVDSSKIHTSILSTHSVQNAKILAKAINNMQVYKNFCYSTLTHKEVHEDCKAKYSDTEGVVAYLIDTKGVDLAVLITEKEDKTIKASFRSKEIDVNKIANVFGGGGHKLASGATLSCSIEEAISQITEEVKKYINF